MRNLLGSLERVAAIALGRATAAGHRPATRRSAVPDGRGEERRCFPDSPAPADGCLPGSPAPDDGCFPPTA
ncbi:MAG TPA: hypothetical protein VFW16_00960 [Streptosporangiaceae bacterium]|nr:hypothetical protein [Streptosporangiaceae bacterium]